MYKFKLEGLPKEHLLYNFTKGNVYQVKDRYSTHSLIIDDNGLGVFVSRSNLKKYFKEV